MAAKRYQKDDIIISASQSNDEIFIITEGAVFASAPGVKFNLGKGDVIGCLEYCMDAHFISYMATEDTSVIVYSKDSIEELFKAKNDFSAYYLKSLNKQIHTIINLFFADKDEASKLYHLALDCYELYTKICSKAGIEIEEIPELTTFGDFYDDTEISEYIKGYYEQINALVKDGRTVLPDYLIYYSLKSSKDSRSICLGAKKVFIYLTKVAKFLLDDTGLDIYGLLCEVYFAVKNDDTLAEPVLDSISTISNFLDEKAYLNPNLYFNRTNAFNKKLERILDSESLNANEAVIYKEVADSAKTIAEYAGLEEAEINDLRSLLVQYEQLKDYTEISDSSRHLRLDLTNIFYKIYEKAFFVSLRDTKIPRIVKMFFEFGYLDEHLVSKEDLMFMYHRAGTKYADPDRNVFTFYEWLKAIYDGRRLPSRNEFDVDYETFVHEQKIKNQITASEEQKLMLDRKEMVLYELKNMFLTANKVTFGRISIFCPIYNSANIIGKISAKALDTDIVSTNLSSVRSTDFGIFYRETLYKNEKLGITSEYVNTEIIPDVILMPNAGIRSILWQEIQGRVRNTHARMLLPVIDMEDIKVHILRMCGEYRWEMCKRIQGGRWNDVSDPSLTSEYFDYVQFYRKNHDLSNEAKEKIKTALTRAKNSFKEMFIYDYIVWVAYESDGSPRLNKVSRSIIGKYCSFPSQIREKLKSNPTYKDIFTYYDTHQAQKIHRMENLILKIQNSGADAPKELLEELEFLKR